MPSVIALDAMGSDRAPKPEIEGAIHAARQYGLRVLLVGPETVIKAELDRHPSAARLPLEVVHASEFITMEDKVEAIRAKRDSSMRVGLRMVREGQAAGFVTAGNTGAAMATAKVVLGAVPGVDRPALAAVFPTAPGNPAMLLDVGANVDCTPQNLEQFAVMGDIYFRAMFGKRAGTSGSARRIAFHWRRGKQGERTYPPVLSFAQAASAEFCGQCGRPRPLQRAG